MSRESNKRHSFVVNILLFVVILALCFVAGELIVRALYKDSTVLFPRYHTEAAYGDFTIRKIRPNSRFTHTSVDGSWSFQTNKQGFRNHEDFEYVKPDGKIRIVSIGDSHTQGYECDQDYTYSRVIEKYLRNAGYDVEVFNTGVSGFSTSEALVLLENELVKYSPDFVVLGFFANDYQDNLKSGLYGLDESNELVIRKYVHIPGVNIQNIIYSVPGVKWLSENSYLYSALFNQAWLFFKRKLSSSARNKQPGDHATNKKESAGNIEVAVATTKTFSKYQIDLASALIRKISEVTQNAGAKLIILDIPQTDVAHRSKTSVVDELLPTVQASSDYFVSDDVLKSFQGSARLHLPNGHRHISEFTHTILGTEVAKYIESAIIN